MGLIGSLTRSFMCVLNTQEAHGLNHFLDLIDEREDVTRRKRGLITGSYMLMAVFFHKLIGL